MRIAIVGAGLAGMAAAAALTRSGHAVTVYEQAGALRASGLAINMWSNATTLLPRLGIPAADIPGEPFTRMLVRAGGRDVAEIDVTPRGLPNVNVRRGAILGALDRTLPPGTVRYGERQADPDALAAGHDLVVVADGTRSALRASVTGEPGRRWAWNVWQATVPTTLPEMPKGAGSSVPGSGRFVGIWRVSDDQVTWFAEEPGRPAGQGPALLAELRDDPDPMVRGLAAVTTEDQWTEWDARDLWPSRTPYRGNVVLVGDAAHASLPTLGQGACQAVEDAAVLARAIDVEPTVAAALRRYARIRVRRTREVVALSRLGALGRRPNPMARFLPDTATAKQMALGGGPLLRRLTRPRVP